MAAEASAGAAAAVTAAAAISRAAVKTGAAGARTVGAKENPMVTAGLAAINGVELNSFLSALLSGGA